MSGFPRVGLMLLFICILAIPSMGMKLYKLYKRKFRFNLTNSWKKLNKENFCISGLELGFGQT